MRLRVLEATGAAAQVPRRDRPLLLDLPLDRALAAFVTTGPLNYLF